MKLVIEKWKDGSTYVMFETEKHNKKNNKIRSNTLTKLDSSLLLEECDMDIVFQHGSYMEFSVEK
ncbi:MAG: hypothetical protein AABY22_05910 [Nanoarchaeota archaeon]